MEEINSGQNNQAYLIQYGEKGAKFSQVSDTKLSWEGTNWLSRLVLKCGYRWVNKSLSRRCIAQANENQNKECLKNNLGVVWKLTLKDFNNLSKANPFACFCFVRQMGRIFDKALSEGFGFSIREYLSVNNALPPKDKEIKFCAPDAESDMKIFSITINSEGEIKVDGCPMQNVKISFEGGDDVTITGKVGNGTSGGLEISFKTTKSCIFHGEQPIILQNKSNNVTGANLGESMKPFSLPEEGNDSKSVDTTEPKKDDKKETKSEIKVDSQAKPSLANSSDQVRDEENSIYGYLKTKNALPPKGMNVEFQVFSPSAQSEFGNMRISNESVVFMPFLGGTYETIPSLVRRCTTKNVTFVESENKTDIIITGEYCDRYHNNAWKNFSCQARKEDVYCWKGMNDVLAKLTDEKATVDLGELMKNVPAERYGNGKEKLVNATKQGEPDEKKTQLKMDVSAEPESKFSLFVIDGEKKIPLNYPEISKGPDSEHLIISAQDGENQQCSFVVDLRDLISKYNWRELGNLEWESGNLESGERVSLRRYLEKQPGKFWDCKRRTLDAITINNDRNNGNGKITIDMRNNTSYLRFEDKWNTLKIKDESVPSSHGEKGQEIQGDWEIQKVPKNNKWVYIGIKGCRTRFEVELAKLLNESGWKDQPPGEMIDLSRFLLNPTKKSNPEDNKD